MILIDTDVAVHWRDGQAEVMARLIGRGERIALSAISRAELENGVYRDPSDALARRDLLDALLTAVVILDFTDAVAARFGAIVAATGYSRRKTNDRMIAATALHHDLDLVTMNVGDYADVPRLRVVDWSDAV
jgi:tRNA(fMet)-specific endonuclease VapC